MSRTTRSLEDVSEVVDATTGEIIPTLDLNSSSKALDLSARKAIEMSEKDFEDYVDAFWKPQDSSRGDPQKLAGAYLGFVKKGKLKMHAIRAAHPTKKNALITKRFVGTAQLNDQLKDAPNGLELGKSDEGGEAAIATGFPQVLVAYLGESKTTEGQRLHNFKVRWGRQA